MQFILDRPHSITHSCSPVYMPDESFGATAGVATRAAEVSHSIAVVNRTSLAYMAPATYMIHKMTQVALMNVRKLHRLSQASTKAENDHISLSPFYHLRLSRACQRGVDCSCSSTVTDGGPGPASWTLTSKIGSVRAVDNIAKNESDLVFRPPVDGDERLCRASVVAPDHAGSGTTGESGELNGGADRRPTGVSSDSIDVIPSDRVPLRRGDGSSVVGDVDRVRQVGSSIFMGDVATGVLGDRRGDEDEGGTARPGDGAANVDELEAGGLCRRSSGLEQGSLRALDDAARGARFAPLSAAPLPADFVAFVESLGMDGSFSVPVRPLNKARYP